MGHLGNFFSTSEYEQLIPLFPFSELGIQILYLVGKQKENVWHGSVDICESGYVRGRRKERLRKALNSDPIFLPQEKFCGSQLSEGNSHAQSNDTPKSKGRPLKAVTAHARERELGMHVTHLSLCTLQGPSSPSGSGSFSQMDA